MHVNVDFKQVGRDRMNWCESVEADSGGQPLEQQMYKAVKRKKAVLSSDVEFSEGIIYVGGVRPVGSYEIKQETP